jgi:hypothetical protein
VKGNQENMSSPKKKKSHDLRVLEGTEEANKRNKARKFCTIAQGVKAGFQP